MAVGKTDGRDPRDPTGGKTMREPSLAKRAADADGPPDPGRLPHPGWMMARSGMVAGSPTGMEAGR